MKYLSVFKRNKNILMRSGALVLSLLLLCFSLSSCKARPLAKGKLARTEVGTVGDYTVYYEELYYLASSYKELLKDDYKDDSEGLSKAISDAVSENIIVNYAILDLCKDAGLEYDEKELSDDVEDYLELIISSEFDGSRKDYLESKNEQGLTDSYVRFTTGVNLLYDRLATKYQETGVVPNSDEKMIEHIKKNFVHTWHIAVFVNEGESEEENLEKITDAYKLLESGQKSMYKLIGSSYNEDITPAENGYCFTKGEMEQEYEDASFALKVGEHSEIVESIGKNPEGRRVKCYYLIERLAIDDEYIQSNFENLADAASNAIIVNELELKKASLKFTPNEFASALDYSSLEAPKDGWDYLPFVWCALGILGCAAVVTAVIVITKVRTKRFHQKLTKSNKKL